MPSRFLREIPESLLVGSDPSAAASGADEDPSLDYSYSQDDLGQVRIGARVRHPVFGVGAVIGASGSGPSQKLKIRFDRVGVKTVLVRFANLEPV